MALLLLVGALVACGSAGDGSSTVTTVVPDDSGGTPAPVETTTSELPFVVAARADLAGRLGVEPDSITLVDARSVTWGDRSFGCPEPGMRYLPGVIEGVVVVLEADGRPYEYHGGEGTAPFLCEPGRGPVR
jgi:hypothetical protein